MRFPVPFGYEADVLTASNRRVTRRYRELAEVEIPDFEAGALPSVVTWAGQHAYEGRRVDALHHGGHLYEVVTVRTWTGNAYEDRPVAAAEAEAAVRAAFTRGPETPVAGTVGIREVFVQGGQRKVFRDQDPFSHKGPPKPATVLRDWDSERERDAARALADGFVVLGGILHRQIFEPVLVASDKGVYLAAEPGEAPRRRLFRLDDLDLALARARTLGAEAPVAPAFVLHRPDLLGRDLEASALYDTLRALLDLARKHLPVLPLSAMEAYCDLNEARYPASQSWDRPASEPDPADLVRLGRVLREALLPHLEEPVALAEVQQGLDRAEDRLLVPVGPVPA